MKSLFGFTFCLICLSSIAQTDTSSNTLDSITIKAFGQARRQRDVAAAVNVLDSQLLRRFAPTSVVQAINTTAGVRMEERSPGSYRINIRGSSLRSPFGVRNVKVYYNDIPITDPGGQTYLNALGFYNYQRLEVIKGPGSSLYGAGTGGVMLVDGSTPNAPPSIEAEFTTGSYGNRQLYTAVNLGKSSLQSKLSWQHQRSDGYRDHSALERDVVTWEGRYNIKRTNLLTTTLLFSHLFYQTPGALTLTEYQSRRRSARPAGGGFPSSQAANASIDQKTLIAGITYDHRFSSHISGKIVGYAINNRFKNPAVRNYGINDEPHRGVRTSLRYQNISSVGKFQLVLGGELQRGKGNIAVYGNRAGVKDTVQTIDRLRTAQSFAFLQADYEWKNWLLTAGTSLNVTTINFQRLTPAFPKQTQRFSNELAPRFSLARRFKMFTVYTSVAKGFSPPTTGEIFPSGSAVNLELSPERGWNYEAGLRGKFGPVDVDINAFSFSLENMVVQRRDAGGGDYYINAGNTSQRGLETSVGWTPFTSTSSLRASRFWATHTWHRFRYQEFKQLATDFSGKQLPGVMPTSLFVGADLVSTAGFSANVNYGYQAAVPLNDANTAYATDYHLVNAKFGFARMLVNGVNGNFSVGVENLLDAQYSLGNDINAFGGRYYNAAPGRTWYLSLALQLFARSGEPKSNQ